MSSTCCNNVKHMLQQQAEAVAAKQHMQQLPVEKETTPKMQEELQELQQGFEDMKLDMQHVKHMLQQQTEMLQHQAQPDAAGGWSPPQRRPIKRKR
jgi:uncharacterized membrane protein (DUF106 family)